MQGKKWNTTQRQDEICDTDYFQHPFLGEKQLCVMLYMKLGSRIFFKFTQTWK